MKAWIVLMLPASLAAVWAQGTGLRGRVVDEAGAPLNGALVTAAREYVTAADAAKSRYWTVTKADGSFEILGMEPGLYAVCSAKPPHEGYVDFCAWTLQPPRVTITAGVVMGGYQIRLEKGVRLEVAVRDPDELLRGKAEARKQQQLRLRVAAGGVPANRMVFSHSDREKAEYFLVVPRRMAMKVFAEAEEADVSLAAEATGRKLAVGQVEAVDAVANRRVEFRYHRKKE